MPIYGYQNQEQNCHTKRVFIFFTILMADGF
uniref:Uncharacterized protein n=1 Tax=Setaria italica TaxID=4555 RepID=K4APH4_SETIT